ncbi:S-layer homology domain-containing protein [Anaerovorax odorimutans]|uniref:S-layer homology domain-containing protein n=1 Tax=Anaerovorax odorimutans TaxID=109327 RepID=UPI0004198FDF|nr:S-layer homology domain-containing protein [Anaerovorax odorimutans]
MNKFKLKKVLALIFVLAFMISSTITAFAAAEISFVTNGAAKKYAAGSVLRILGKVEDNDLAISKTNVEINITADGKVVYYGNITTDSNGYFKTTFTVPSGVSGNMNISMNAAGNNIDVSDYAVLDVTETLVLAGSVPEVGLTEADNKIISASTSKIGLAFSGNVNYFNNKNSSENGLPESLGTNDWNKDCITLYEKESNGDYKKIPSSIDLVSSSIKGNALVSGITYFSGVAKEDQKSERKDVIFISAENGFKANTSYKIAVDKDLCQNSSARMASDETVYFTTGSASNGGNGSSGSGTGDNQEKNTVIVSKPTFKGTTATIAPTDTQINDAVKSLNKDDKNIITFKVSESDISKNSGDINVLELKISEAQRDKIKDSKLAYDTPIGTVTLPTQVISQVRGDIDLTITKVEEDTYKVTLTDEKGNISNLNGRVKLKFQVNDKTKNLLSHNGVIMKNAMVENGEAFGITSSFSTFKLENKSVTFSDISKHWAKSNIEFLAARNIVNGVSEDEFAPNNNITRAEFVKMLINSLDELDIKAGSATNSFKDVKEGKWYTDYINWAAEKGIVSGMGNDTFGTDRAISRQDMAVIIERFANEMNIDLSANINKVTFADDTEISGYAKESVYKMQQAGIINGVGGNNFNAKDSATRAEVAKIINMLIEDLVTNN